MLTSVFSHPAVILKFDDKGVRLAQDDHSLDDDFSLDIFPGNPTISFVGKKIMSLWF